MPKYDFNKIAKQLYYNHTSAGVFSCKFAGYFQNTFLKNTSRWLLLKSLSDYVLSHTILKTNSDKKGIQFSSINLFPLYLLSINGMYFPSFNGITLQTPFPKLL